MYGNHHWNIHFDEFHSHLGFLCANTMNRRDMKSLYTQCSQKKHKFNLCGLLLNFPFSFFLSFPFSRQVISTEYSGAICIHRICLRCERDNMKSVRINNGNSSWFVFDWFVTLPVFFLIFLDASYFAHISRMMISHILTLQCFLWGKFSKKIVLGNVF